METTKIQNLKFIISNYELHLNKKNKELDNLEDSYFCSVYRSEIQEDIDECKEEINKANNILNEIEEAKKDFIYMLVSFSTILIKIYKTKKELIKNIRSFCDYKTIVNDMSNIFYIEDTKEFASQEIDKKRIEIPAKLFKLDSELHDFLIDDFIKNIDILLIKNKVEGF